MAKNYRNKHRPKNIPIDNYLVEDQDLPYTNDPATMPTASATGNWNRETPTTTSSIDDSDEESGLFSPAPNNWPTFTTDLLRGQISINSSILVALLIIWFSANIWILIQDNNNQFLQSPNGWIMYANKVGTTTIIFVVTSLIIIIPPTIRRIGRWVRKTWIKTNA